MRNVVTADIKLGSFMISAQTVKDLWRDLSGLVREQGEIEIAALVKADDATEEEFIAHKEFLRNEVFQIVGTVEFDNGSIHSRDLEIVKQEDGQFIRTIYLSNIVPYRNRTGVDPEHSFSLLLDFRMPRLLDADTAISSPTPNNTSFTISGSRPAWRAGVENSVVRRIKSRRPLRGWFHGSFVYDLFLMVCGVPAALYACWYFSGFIARNFSFNGVVQAGAHIYIALLAIWTYRLMFSYARWAFPKVELIDQATLPKRHRRIWWILVAAFVVQVFWVTLEPYISLGPLILGR